MNQPSIIPFSVPPEPELSAEFIKAFLSKLGLGSNALSVETVEYLNETGRRLPNVTGILNDAICNNLLAVWAANPNLILHGFRSLQAFNDTLDKSSCTSAKLFLAAKYMATRLGNQSIDEMVALAQAFNHGTDHGIHVAASAHAIVDQWARFADDKSSSFSQQQLFTAIRMAGQHLSQAYEWLHTGDSYLCGQELKTLAWDHLIYIAPAYYKANSLFSANGVQQIDSPKDDLLTMAMSTAYLTEYLRQDYSRDADRDGVYYAQRFLNAIEEYDPEHTASHYKALVRGIADIAKANCNNNPQKYTRKLLDAMIEGIISKPDCNTYRLVDFMRSFKKFQAELHDAYKWILTDTDQPPEVKAGRIAIGLFSQMGPALMEHMNELIDLLKTIRENIPLKNQALVIAAVFPKAQFNPIKKHGEHDRGFKRIEPRTLCKVLKCAPRDQYSGIIAELIELIKTPEVWKHDAENLVTFLRDRAIMAPDKVIATKGKLPGFKEHGPFSVFRARLYFSKGLHRPFALIEFLGNSIRSLRASYRESKRSK